MKKDLMAVSVGYVFGLVPAEELRGIELESRGAVRYEGENWNLFRAKTFEGSQKLDTLLDQYGEHLTKDHRIEPVIMSGTLQLVVPGFDMARDNLLFGGFSVSYAGKEIPFDFSGIAFDIQQEEDTLNVSFSTGKTPLLTDYFLDDCYEEDYNAAGLRFQDITAKFLSTATALTEFMVALELNGKEYGPEDISRMGGFSIKSLVFENEDTCYAMKQEVLDGYCRSLSGQTHATLQQKIQSAEAKAEEAPGVIRIDKLPAPEL